MGSCSSTTIYLDGRNEKYVKNNVCVCVCVGEMVSLLRPVTSPVHTYIDILEILGEKVRVI